MRFNDVSNQSLHLTPADDLLLQMTGKAAFQRGVMDISSRGKLLPSIATLWLNTLAQTRGEEWSAVVASHMTWFCLPLRLLFL